MPLNKRNVTEASKLLIKHNPEYSNAFTISLEEMNAGVVFPVERGGYRVKSGSIVAKGGAAAGATAVVVTGILNGSEAITLTTPVTGLTQDTRVEFTNGAAIKLALDKRQPITLKKTGAAMTGAVTFNVVVDYAIDN